jgi:hypothetical protein
MIMRQDRHVILEFTEYEASLLRELFYHYESLYNAYMEKGGKALQPELIRLHTDISMNLPRD